MKLKIIIASVWGISKGVRRAFTVDETVRVPEDIPNLIADEMLQHGYAVLVEGASTNPQTALQPDVKKNMPENKTVIPEIQNKLVISPDVNIEDMTKKELINYARSNGVTFDEKGSKESIKKAILKGGNAK